MEKLIMRDIADLYANESENCINPVSKMYRVSKVGENYAIVNEVSYRMNTVKTGYICSKKELTYTEINEVCSKLGLRFSTDKAKRYEKGEYKSVKSDGYEIMVDKFYVCVISDMDLY